MKWVDSGIDTKYLHTTHIHDIRKMIVACALFDLIRAQFGISFIYEAHQHLKKLYENEAKETPIHSYQWTLLLTSVCTVYIWTKLNPPLPIQELKTSSNYRAQQTKQFVVYMWCECINEWQQCLTIPATPTTRNKQYL